MYYVRVIDKDGIFQEDDFVDELTEFTIEEPCPDGFYLPKWNFETEEWQESLTEEEIQAIKDKAESEKVDTPSIEELSAIVKEMLGGEVLL